MVISFCFIMPLSSLEFTSNPSFLSFPLFSSSAPIILANPVWDVGDLYGVHPSMWCKRHVMQKTRQQTRIPLLPHLPNTLYPFPFPFSLFTFDLIHCFLASFSPASVIPTHQVWDLMICDDVHLTLSCNLSLTICPSNLPPGPLRRRFLGS